MDRQYTAARHLLAVTPRGLDFCDDDEEMIDVNALLVASEPWSHGESLLVDAAIDLFNGSTKAGLYPLVNTLGDAWLERVYEAMQHVRGREVIAGPP